MGSRRLLYAGGDVPSGRTDIGAGSATVTALRMEGNEAFIMHIFQPPHDLVGQQPRMAGMDTAPASDTGPFRQERGPHLQREQAGHAGQDGQIVRRGGPSRHQIPENEILRILPQAAVCQ